MFWHEDEPVTYSVTLGWRLRLAKSLPYVFLVLAFLSAVVFLVWIPLGAFADSMLIQISGRLPSPANMGVR